MTTTIDQIDTFTQRAGARETITLNFGTRLGEGDHLSGVPVITPTWIKGYQENGDLTITGIALETGDAPQRCSFLVEGRRGNQLWRLDAVANTNAGEKKVFPVMLEILQ